MSYELFIGDRTYSSWSLRGWLMFERFGVPVRTRMVGLYDGTLAADLAPVAPARTVPAMRTPEGHVVSDTLAMAETLAERHPGAGFWPADPKTRALARTLVAEMHSGFAGLRGTCPMNLAIAYRGFEPEPEVIADLERIESLWQTAWETSSNAGSWLFGEYSLADVFFAPVAARIATYGLPVGPAAADYVSRHLADGAFRRWRAMGATKVLSPAPYALPLTKIDWPGPPVLNARAIDASEFGASGAENAACPYSGKPVTHHLELDSRTFGFCNPFCRDKTVHDPEAWPAFMEIYRS